VATIPQQQQQQQQGLTGRYGFEALSCAHDSQQAAAVAAAGGSMQAPGCSPPLLSLEDVSDMEEEGEDGRWLLTGADQLLE
jgi:hypothetical protein